jgi:hypothetical protein
MRRPRLFLVLIGLVIALGIVTVAMAASLASDGDDDAEPNTIPRIAEASTPTQEPAVVPVQPEEIPDDIWAEIQELPDKLRDSLLVQFDRGDLDVAGIEQVIKDYESRNQSVRVGTVLEATDSMLRLEVYTTGERAEVVIDDETVLKRGNEDITPSELEPDELVMVLSRDGGETAFAVTAFGVGLP